MYSIANSNCKHNFRNQNGSAHGQRQKLGRGVPVPSTAMHLQLFVNLCLTTMMMRLSHAWKTSRYDCNMYMALYLIIDIDTLSFINE